MTGLWNLLLINAGIEFAITILIIGGGLILFLITGLISLLCDLIKKRKDKKEKAK